MNRNFFDELKKAIRDQTAGPDALVANLQGNVAETAAPGSGSPKTQAWYGLAVDAPALPTLRDFVDAFTLQRLPHTELSAVAGRVAYPESGAPSGRALALTTVAVTASATNLPCRVTALGHQVAVYVGGTLVATGVGGWDGAVPVPAGRAYLTILTFGGTAPVVVETATTISMERGELEPSAPELFDTPSVTYLRAANGSYRTDLEWANDPYASAWAVYRSPFTALGTASAASFLHDTTEVVLRLPTSAAMDRLGFGVAVVVDDALVGTVAEVTAVWSGETLVGHDVTIALRSGAPTTAGAYIGSSVQASTEDYQALGRVTYGGTPTLRFSDTGGVEGEWYAYRVTAFGFLLGSAESAYSEPVVVRTRDTTVPGSIVTNVTTDLTIVNGQVTLDFTSPADEDYRGVKIFDPNGDELSQEQGLPGQRDILIFRPTVAGTYEFRTYDWAGNVQAQGTGVSWTWDGSEQWSQGVTGLLTAAVTGSTADLTLTVDGHPSLFPVEVEFYRDTITAPIDLGGGEGPSVTVGAPGSVSHATLPGLADLALPLGGQVSFWARMTNAQGTVTWAFTTASRGAVPGGVVTVDNYRPQPVFTLVYDDDTTQIVVKNDGAPVATLTRGSGLAASGPGSTGYTYSGTLAEDAVDTGWTVEYTGGGGTIVLWAGSLYGRSTASATGLTGDTLAPNVVFSSLQSLGATVTGGTYNGQTISSAAAFTGTMAIGTIVGLEAATLRVGGDIRASGTIYATNFVLTGGAGSGSGLGLDTLDDVDLDEGTLAQGQFLRYTTAYGWRNQGLAAADFGSGTPSSLTFLRGDLTWATVPIIGALDDLSDVALTPPSVGHVLRWNGSAYANAALVAADIPTLTAAKISDFDTQVRTSRLDQFAAPTAAVSLGGQRLTNLGAPTADGDAATKAYVDAASQGLNVKEAARAATTGNITLSGTQTIDGVALVAGNRVLVKNQSTPSQNGVYVVAAGAWTRATDFDDSAEVSAGAFIFVQEGATLAGSGWVLTTTGTVTIGTTALTFEQFSGAGQLFAGAGLTRSGSTIDVGGTANRIVVNADSIDIAATYVGQSSITTLGTIATGTWQGTAIANAYIASGLDVAKLTAGTTLPSNVVSSSLTTVGTLTALTVSGGLTHNGASVSLAQGASAGGGLTVGPTSTTSGVNVNIRGSAGFSRGYLLSTGTTSRWYVYVDQNAETGSNAGSGFGIAAYTDAGTFIDTPFAIARGAGGSITMARPVSMTSTLAVTGLITGSVSGNAGTATALQAPRALWGQSFDGTAAIGGPLEMRNSNGSTLMGYSQGITWSGSVALLANLAYGTGNIESGSSYTYIGTAASAGSTNRAGSVFAIGSNGNSLRWMVAPQSTGAGAVPASLTTVFSVTTSGNLTIGGTLAMVGALTGATTGAFSTSVTTPLLIGNTVSSRDKLRVWDSNLYTIGFGTTYTFGGLTNYAMTFQVNDTAARGWWWGRSTHTNAQGAMALTNEGYLTVADAVRIGYGTADTTAPSASGYKLDVSGDVRATGTIYATNFVLTGGAGSGTGISLDNLDDVIITAPTSAGQLLRHDGVTWVNAPLAALGTGTASAATFLRGDGAWASAAVAARDEGTLLTAAATEFNFTGAGVVATNSGGVVTVNITGAVTSVFGRTGAVTLLSSDVTTALGFTPLSASTTSTQNGYFGDIFLRDDTNASHYLQITNAEDASAGRTLNILVGAASRTVTLSGNLTLANNFTTSGNFALTLTTTGATNVTLPTSGTLVTTTGSISGTAGNVTGTVAIGNGGTGATTAPNARTNLGATTVGSNLFTLTNPSAVGFLRINADNTVSVLDAASFRTAIGAGTVTSIATAGTVSGLTLTGGTITSSGTITLGGTLAVTPSNFSSQTANTFLAAPNGAAGVPSFRAIVAADIPTLNQNTTGSAATLTTPRALWGQSFDGSAAIGGRLEMKGSIGEATMGYSQGISWAGSVVLLNNLSYNGGNISLPGSYTYIGDANSAGSTTRAGSVLMITGNGNSIQWLVAPTSTGAGASPVSLTSRFNLSDAGLLTIGNSLVINGTITGATNITASGTVTAATLAGTLSTAAQPNVTSVGTLTGLTVSGASPSFNTGNAVGTLTLGSTAAVTQEQRVRLANSVVTGGVEFILNSSGTSWGFYDRTATKWAVQIARGAPDTVTIGGNLATPGTLAVSGATTLAALSATTGTYTGLVQTSVAGHAFYASASTAYATIGGSPSSNVKLYLRGTVTGSVNEYAILTDITTTASATTSIRGIDIRLTTTDAVYTTANLYGIIINNPTKGAQHTITTAYGLYVTHPNVGGTNWSIYTTGQVRFGGTVTVSTGGISVTGNSTITGTLGGISTLTAASMIATTRTAFTGYSASWGVTTSVTTAGPRVVMGTATGATWLIAGTSNDSFRAGWQVHDSTLGLTRLYGGANYMETSAGTGTTLNISNLGTLTATTFSGALSGNATTATTLQTGRLINGTSFNGSANITTANWGTARTLTIGATGKSVNGSANVSWSLAEIGALGATAKAADSELFDGVDSSRFIFGTTGSGSRPAATTQNVYELAHYKSGFWEVQNASWAPSLQWYWGATFAHTSNTGSYNYSGQLVFELGQGGNGLYARTIDNGSPTAWARLLSSGNFSSYALPLTGGTLTGSLTAPNFILSSDLRLKDRVTEIRGALEVVRQVPGITYWHTVARRHELGFGAQHLLATAVGALITTADADGMYGVAYDRTIPVLWQAVREQDQFFAVLDGQVRRHGTEIAELKAKVADLERRLAAQSH